MKIDFYVEKYTKKRYSIRIVINSSISYSNLVKMPDLYAEYRSIIDKYDWIKHIDKYMEKLDISYKWVLCNIDDLYLTIDVIKENIKLHLPDDYIAPKRIYIEADYDDNYIFTKLTVDGKPLTEEEYHELLNHPNGYACEINGNRILVNQDMLLYCHNKRKRIVTFLKDMSTCQISEKYILFKNNYGMSNFKFDNRNGLFKQHQVDAIEYIIDSFGRNMGILLADDMGLGKTATAIGVISSVKSDRPALVVVPKSVVGNWIKEFSRFAPEKRCYPYKGHQLHDNCVYIATYGDMTHDLELTEHTYSTVVLDEAQQIKNHRTVASARLRMIKTENRLAMTGTPMENSLMDLWSIMDFVEPGLLGTYKEFKPLSKLETNLDDVLKCIRPFCIRRMKSDIETLNLPSKTEHIVSVDMCDMEKKLYNGIIDEYIAESKRDSTATVIKYISKLKMMCGNPRMMFNVDTEPSKLAHVREIIRNTGDKPFVVFTQYRKTAEMLCENLNSLYGKCGIIIDGTLSANERTAISDRFQKGEYPFIVLTLKAGNCGLTLTNSCNLIHYDRWWNPAVENQATDRVYRIGQKNDVNIYKLVCKGTIEERIGKILDSKTKMFNSVVEIIKENSELLERKINE